MTAARDGRSRYECTQLQTHLVGGFESQALVERPAVFAGVQSDMHEPLFPAPVDHGLHEPAGNALAAILRIGVHVENRGAPALAIIGMAGPRADQDHASGHHLFSRARQPAAEGTVRQRRRQIGLAGRHHRRQGHRVVVAHVFVHAAGGGAAFQECRRAWPAE